MNIEETVLPNKLRVITNKVLSSKTTAVGAFIPSGSRQETEENNGVAHFLEHMAFKGTTKRKAFDISHEIEVLGSWVNAQTDKNSTAYYSKGLKQHIGTSVDVLGDVLTDSVFDEPDIRLESGAILQEIAVYEDDPTSIMFELLEEIEFPNQPLGRKILGTK